MMNAEFPYIHFYARLHFDHLDLHRYDLLKRLTTTKNSLTKTTYQCITTRMGDLPYFLE